MNFSSKYTSCEHMNKCGSSRKCMHTLMSTICLRKTGSRVCLHVYYVHIIIIYVTVKFHTEKKNKNNIIFA